MTVGRTVFRNNSAIAAWIFMAIWGAGLLAITGLFIRDGGFHQFDPMIEYAILGVFWLFGTAGTAYFFGFPRIHVVVENNEIVVRERWLWRNRIERFPVRDVGAPQVVEEKDSDGDPCFRCVFAAPSGRSITVSESHHRPAVVAECDRLLAAIGRG